MAKGIRIEAPSSVAARDLLGRLRPLCRPEIVAVTPDRAGDRRRWEIRLSDSSHAFVRQLLPILDAWLDASDLGTISVYVDGQQYRMSRSTR